MGGRRPSKVRKKKIRVGDSVVLHLGPEDVFAEVVEDRGFIGVGGRQLLRIRRVGVSPELAEPYEVPAEELELAEWGLRDCGSWAIINGQATKRCSRPALP